MKRHAPGWPRLVAIALTLAACSRETASPPSSPEAQNTNQVAEPPSIAAAKRACEHLKQLPSNGEQMDVGISNYEACLGNRANLTRPASLKLCALARSHLSADGICILSE